MIISVGKTMVFHFIYFNFYCLFQLFVCAISIQIFVYKLKCGHKLILICKTSWKHWGSKIPKHADAPMWTLDWNFSPVVSCFVRNQWGFHSTHYAQTVQIHPYLVWASVWSNLKDIRLFRESCVTHWPKEKLLVSSPASEGSTARLTTTPPA